MTVEKGRMLWAPGSVLEDFGPLPLRLRDRDGAILAEGMAGSEFEARPGTYRLAVTMPDKVELLSCGEVTIEPGRLAEPRFEELEEALKTYRRSRQEQAAERPAQRSGARRSLGMRALTGGASSSIPAMRWRGRWLSLWNAGEEGEDFRDPLDGTEGATSRLRIGGETTRVKRDGEPDDVLIVDHKGARSAFVLPGDRDLESSDPLEIGISLGLNEDMPSLRFVSPLGDEPNAYIQYVDKGMLGESRRIALELIGDEDGAKGEMRGSLLRAIVAGYVLLRANELSEAEWLTERLVRYAPACPDVHIIRMEGLARLGGADNHKAAVAALRSALGRGCPWFRSGISYALERLRLYLSVNADEAADFELHDPIRLEGWKRRYHFMLRRLDTNQLFTTFRLPPINGTGAGKG